MASPSVPTYCTAQNVVDFLRILDDDGTVLNIGQNTDPTLAQVNEIIMNEEDELDNRMGHTWKETRAITESLDLPLNFDWFFGMPIHLRHRKIREIDPTAGDFIRVLYPSEKRDITPNENSWWRMNYEIGIIYLLGMVWYSRREKRLEISYRYGDSEVPRWLKRATIQSTAITLMETSLSMSKITVQEGVDLNKIIDRWRKDVDLAIANNAEIQAISYIT